MPTAPVDDSGHFLYYEDTGPVEGRDDYVTVVGVHGLIFHGTVYKPLVPYAKEHGLRLIWLEWRDYPNSSPYSPEELAAFTSPDRQVQAQAIEREGDQLGRFLKYIIETKGIPSLKVVNGEKRGGLSVLIWSLGSVFALPFFAHAHKLDEPTKKLFGKYLRSVIPFAPPVAAIGKPIPLSFGVPFTNPDNKLEDLPQIFIVWVSSHYPAVRTLENVTEDSICAEARPADPSRQPTIFEMSEEEREDVMQLSVLASSAGAIMHIHGDVFWENVVGTLFDTKSVWPDVDATLLWCNMDINECVWGAKIIDDAIREHERKGTEGRRKVRTVMVDGANHFLHWHDPERMAKIIAKYA